ncbi:MAG: DNA polymerase III subunit gamma/tau [Peptococcaceae bacterium]|jgi:DNA polymerase-3 subunit gamma/tau|nr:MAG: DNA polymerase III subunit gamma/tau [Peptococcaceae bacterium]
MSYLALYREYRPQTFREIVGQEHVTRTLQNAVKGNRVAHAYLFCGSRGTGKTTSAKVLAKAVNCLQGPDPEPCNECTNCRAVTEGVAVDVAEIDAASNRGIDEIRDLREKVQFAPSTGRYRVYIIDEVHMLTNEAFNALLKILEEPPGHVIFILATTEPRKVPLTILSRCQRFDFRRIGIGDIINKLKEVVEKTGLAAEEEALRLIARAAEGSLRDALSMLDQAAALGGNLITVEEIHNILGTVRMDVLNQVAGHLAAGESGPVLQLVGRLYKEGKDLRLFASDLAGFLRTLLLLKISPATLTDEYSPAELLSQVELFEQEQLMYILDILTGAEQDMKWSNLPNLVLELALVKACRMEWRVDTGSLAGRLARLEEAVFLGGEKELKLQPSGNKHSEPVGFIPAREPHINVVKDSCSKHSEPVDFIPAGEIQAAATIEAPVFPGRDDQAAEDAAITLETVKSAWTDLVKKVKEERIPLYGSFVKAVPVEVKGGQLIIGFAEDARLAKERVEQEDNKRYLEQLLRKFFDGEWHLSCIFGAGGKPPEARPTLAEEALRRFGGEEVELNSDGGPGGRIF